MPTPVRTGPPEPLPTGRTRAERGRSGLRHPAPGARDAAETVVRISIERLEVRAAPPASPAARPQDAGRTRKAGPGLDEYLRGRT
ncbi:hypothetical protein [Streptomyces sp. URMC 124]|uniref:hypothetical protein n=1 Tax=Streptomyces sp. URMC 124 TaxID=3423405 RepID=UPI003F1C9478